MGDRVAPDTRTPASELDRAEQLRLLVHKHYSSIWRFLRRLGFDEHIADDAAQDLFVVAVRRFDQITPGSERAFLYGAALRIATAMKRKHAREVPVDPLDAGTEVAAPATTFEERLDDERARELLYRLLSELDERFRIVFVLYELEELTMPEISNVLQIPPGTAASRLRSARETIRARLERHRMRVRGQGGT